MEKKPTYGGILEDPSVERRGVEVPENRVSDWMVVLYGYFPNPTHNLSRIFPFRF